MKRIALILLLVIFIVSTCTFCAGLGYGLGGGKVEMFANEAHSDSGVAIAAYVNQGEISAENQAEAGPGQASDELGLLVLILGGTGTCFLYFAVNGKL